MKERFSVHAKELQGLSTLNVTQLFGVDYYNPQLNIANNHGMDVKNVVFKSNAVQTRRGYVELYDLKDLPESKEGYINENGEKKSPNLCIFNGVWEFTSFDKKKRTIMHLGNLMYEVSVGNTKDFTNTTMEVLKAEDKCFTFNNNQSQAFASGGRLYHLDGTTFKMIYFDEEGICHVEKVEENPKTYIPTTTIGITQYGSNVSKRQSLDAVNMMTQWRKNKFVTGISIADNVIEENLIFDLDTTIVPHYVNEINDIEISIDTVKEGE